MQTRIAPWIAGVLMTVSACSSEASPTDEAVVRAAEASADGHGSAGHGASGPFAPPPPLAGYTRFVAPVMKGIEPGANVSHCQYIQAPLDRDVDVLDVQGFQSTGGHHAVAYATPMAVPVGTSRECTDQDQLLGGFLGGVGGEATGGVELPPGVAFRLPKGSAIMLSTHFVNTSDDVFDGRAVVDFKFAEPDGKRIIASLFSSGSLNIRAPVGKNHQQIAECVMARDMKFILFTNHMHEWGTSAKTEVVRPSGAVELIHEDPRWQPELAFKAAFTKWKVDAPLVLSKGDKLRTYCNWNNTTKSDLTFPGEMCFGVGFFLSDGSSSPVCMDGNWIER